VEAALKGCGAELSGKRIHVLADAGQLPRRASELKAYGAVVLVNVPAGSLSPSRVAALEGFVRDFGGGLVVFGGNRSFDMGQYAGSNLERILPVQSKPDHPKRRKLGFGLLFVVDISGSMAGVICDSKRAVAALWHSVPAESTVGVVTFDSEGSVVWPLRRALPSDRQRLMDEINKLDGRGGTRLGAGLEKARQEIASLVAGAGGKGVRGHVFVLSDGQLEDDMPGLKGLARDLARMGWPVHAIGVGSGVNETVLKEIAAAGQGTSCTFPQIPRLEGPHNSTTALMYALKRVPNEPVFDVSDFDVQVLASVADFNRTERLKPWGSESLVFDDPKSPTALAHGRLGLGRSLACLYEVEGYWSYGLLEGRQHPFALVLAVAADVATRASRLAWSLSLYLACLTLVLVAIYVCA